MLKDKKILIGITGCIGVYKICSLVNHLKKEDAIVKVIMTEAATKFVTPLTFQTLTNSLVYLDTFDAKEKTKVEHIFLADWCDILLLAPATANTIAKIAHGICDNLLTTIISALQPQIKVLVAPAMNCHMWENPLTQQNIKILESIKFKKKEKYRIIGPAYGNLACGYTGEGKIIDNKILLRELSKRFRK